MSSYEQCACAQYWSIADITSDCVRSHANAENTGVVLRILLVMCFMSNPFVCLKATVLSYGQLSPYRKQAIDLITTQHEKPVFEAGCIQRALRCCSMRRHWYTSRDHRDDRKLVLLVRSACVLVPRTCIGTAGFELALGVDLVHLSIPLSLHLSVRFLATNPPIQFAPIHEKTV